MNPSSKLIPNYLPVWEQQYEKIKNIIKDEIEKPKKDRKKEQLKRMLHECKELKKLIFAIRGESDVDRCPNCGHKL